jgi:hypothetical protein
MIPLIENKFFLKPALLGFLSLMVPLAQAWVTPVDMNADHEGSGNNTITTSLGELDRCDTVLDGYTGSIPSQCHRRNLVWQLGSKDGGNVAQPLAQWDPELGGEANWRLPTIKELSRLVDYSSYSKGKEALTDQPLILKMFPSGLTPSNAWLISSTYRDIDGDAANGQAQIFGINMGTGEIATFDTVNNSSVADVSEQAVAHDNPGSVAIGDVITASNLIVDGTQTIETIAISVINSSDASSINVDGVKTTQIITLEKCDSLNVDVNEDVTCNLSDADVYALLVHINTVSELITP